MSIMAVFCAGLGKLWWNNRLMKKQEVLDVEKRARVEELRKTGLPMKRANLIPFGVRAIQSGVEVDGIWISRPASLNELGEKLASSTTLGGRDSDSQKKGRYHSSSDERSVVVTTASLDRGGPKQSPSTASIFQKLTDTDSTDDSTHAAAPSVSQFASHQHKPTKRHPSRQPTTSTPGSSTLNEDTLRRLEGHHHSPSKPHHHYETYIPTTSSPSSPRRNPRQRSPAASSSADSVDSQPKSASSRSYHTSSSQSSRLYMAAAARSPPPPAQQYPQAHASSPSGLSAFSLQEGGEMMVHGGREEMAAPEPTFGPGDLHFNRASRRVNGGFEVLPAGTFAVGMPGEREERSGGRGSTNTGSQGNRLRKSEG
jgi:hypothetical protein